jgi:hypothetical protein
MGGMGFQIGSRGSQVAVGWSANRTQRPIPVASEPPTCRIEPCPKILNAVRQGDLEIWPIPQRG